MSRRKQAKPRSVKQSCEEMLPGPDSAWNSPPSPLSPASSHDSEFTIHSETEESCSEEANSASELADSELGCTVGVTESTPYPCHFCQKAFPRLSYLNRHEQTHSEHMPFRCEYCSRLFKHKRSRDRHIKLHTGDKKYRCMQCEAAFSRSDHLKIHMKTHDNQKPFQCNVCNRGYNTAAALTSHMQNHKRPMEEESISGPSSFKCLHCNWTFERAEELMTHIGKKHNGASGYASNKRKRTDLPSTITNLACKYCTKVNFDSIEILKHHIQEMHGLLLKETDPSDLSQPRPSPSLGEVSCPLCTMAFATTGALHSHVTSVHGINQGRDPDQFASYYSKSVNNNDLEERSYIHKNTHIPSLSDQTKPTDLSVVKKQEDDRPIIVKKNRQRRQYEHPGTLLCNQCNAALPDFESFRSHLKSHLEESLGTVDPDKSSNQFGHCPYCDSHLPSLQEMTRHIGSHLKATVTEYSCQVCQKPCPKSEEVQRHLLEEHAQRLYRCAVCKDIFESKVAIQVHFTVKHCIEVEKFRCTACPSLPPVDSLLEFTFHLRSAHTRYISSSPTTSSINKSQNFLRCMFCNITFGTEMELRFHLSVHTKQFKCPMCPETFHIEYLLEKHVQSLHGPKVNLKEEQDYDKNCNSQHQNNTPGSNSSSSNGSVVSDLLKRQEAQFNNNNNTTEMCDICECAEFATEAELNAHRKLVHHIKSSSSKVSLHCAYCSENCKSRSELENHMKTHCQGSLTSSKHKCNICDEIFVSIATLAEHKLTHCKVVYGSTCTLCKSVLSSEDDFVKHVLKHNNGLPNRGQQSVSCVVCRQTLQTELETRLHAKFHLQTEKIQCFRCLHNSDKSEIKNNLCFNCHDENNTPKCPHCTVKFETVSLLETHLSTVHNELHQCDKCLVSFESEEEVQAHIDIENCDSCAKWKCNLCMTKMTNHLMLKCHLIEHTFAGCSNFTCYMCTATFTTSSPLQTHMLDHGLQSRPYSCSICPIKFFFRAELDNHNLLHEYKKQISTEKNEPEKIQHFDENSQTTLRRDSKYIGVKSEPGKQEEDYCSMPRAREIVGQNMESTREGNGAGTTDKTGLEDEEIGLASREHITRVTTQRNHQTHI